MALVVTLSTRARVRGHVSHLYCTINSHDFGRWYRAINGIHGLSNFYFQSFAVANARGLGRFYVVAAAVLRKHGGGGF